MDIHDEGATYAALEAAGWERFEGEPAPGFFVMESPSGVRFRRPIMDDPRISAMRERWARQLAEEVALTPYQKRKRREANQRQDAREDALRMGWRASSKVVRREAFRAGREGRTSNVVLFTVNEPYRYAGVRHGGVGAAPLCGSTRGAVS